MIQMFKTKPLVRASEPPPPNTSRASLWNSVEVNLTECKLYLRICEAQRLSHHGLGPDTLTGALLAPTPSGHGGAFPGESSVRSAAPQPCGLGHPLTEVLT